jgi:ATP-dependent DNA helicase RecQ
MAPCVLQESRAASCAARSNVALRQDPKSTAKAAKRTTKTPLPEHIDAELWEALRECRRKLAEEQGVPPYIMFHDKTLQADLRAAADERETFIQVVRTHYGDS